MNAYRTFFLAIISLLATITTSHASGGLIPDKLFDIGSFTVTNSIVTSWVISLLLIIGVRLAVKKPQMNPSKGQSFVELILEGIQGIIEPIVGKHMVKPTFWLLSGIFIYIAIHNWSGLLPGVGSIGWTSESGSVATPFIRPANADVNMTAAIALVAMISWVFLILKYAGPKLIIKDIFGNKANKSETGTMIYMFLGSIFLFVGIIEVASICLRPITLTFRLFGNVYGGESLLATMYNMCAFVVPVPFYFLELLVGLVQGLVFMLLVSVYIGLICNHDSEEGHHH